MQFSSSKTLKTWNLRKLKCKYFSSFRVQMLKARKNGLKAKDRQIFCKFEKITRFEHARAKRSQIFCEKGECFASHIPITLIYITPSSGKYVLYLNLFQCPYHIYQLHISVVINRLHYQIILSLMIYCLTTKQTSA